MLIYSIFSTAVEFSTSLILDLDTANIVYLTVKWVRLASFWVDGWDCLGLMNMFCEVCQCVYCIGFLFSGIANNKVR